MGLHPLRQAVNSAIATAMDNFLLSQQPFKLPFSMHNSSMKRYGVDGFGGIQYRNGFRASCTEDFHFSRWNSIPCIGLLARMELMDGVGGNPSFYYQQVVCNSNRARK